MSPLNRTSSPWVAFHRTRLRPLRVRSLALCLSSIGLSQAAVSASAAPQTWTVQNCDDSGTNSLREIIENPSKAQSGDTVDLRQLPALCGTPDSRITLSTGEIVVAQDDLTLQGPNATSGSVTISGGNASRVFKHNGLGTLDLYDLTTTEGYSPAVGGCIASYGGSVLLNRSTVADCVASNDGGGIFANNVTLVLSRVSGNVASPMANTRGGGIRAGTLIAKYSSITGNAATRGGGIRSANSTTIFASTIDDNTATDSSGGLYTDGQTYVYNSTISGNVAHNDAGALNARADATISNSTIALNHSDYGNAIYFGAFANTHLTLESSIVANNTAGANNTPSDLYIVPGNAILSGSDNLVIAANSSPAGVITVTTDPKLGPLQLNGGWTLTHALSPDSPALGVGNNNAARSYDQRGKGYPRTTGPNGSVDIGAFQFDSIFANNFSF